MYGMEAKQYILLFMQNSQIEETDDEDSKIRFDHFNSEINLLSLNILFESFDRGKDTLTLGDFIKGDYWKEEEIHNEIYDTNDYSTIQDLVLAQIVYLVEKFGIGKIEMVSVVGLDELLKSVIKEAIEEKDTKDIDESVGYYDWIIGEIYGLKHLSGEQQMKAIKKSVSNWQYYRSRVDFENDSDEEGYISIKPLDNIVHAAAPFMEIKVIYKEDGIRKLQEEKKNYILSFSQDAFLDKLPIYRDKRYYFSKQLEIFVEYINKLPLINDCINIPFEVLSEKGFEFVKIASYLEDKGKIKVTNWNDKDIWNIKFYQTPVTVESLLSESKDEEKVEFGKKLKTVLSFDEAKSILEVGEKIVKIRKMSDQYHLLKIIFEDQEEIGKEWFYSEIAEKYDREANLDDKKFYNAAYQISQKIARDTGIRDALITTTQSVRINPEYLR